MNQKVLTTLEFTKVREMLTAITVTSMGKELSASLEPYKDLDLINRKLDETSGAYTLIQKYGPVQLGGAKDLRPSLQRLRVGGNLSIVELLQIGDTLRVVKGLKSYGNQAGEFLDGLDIGGYFQLLDPIHPLYREISAAILSEEEIADDASPKLYDIRREIKNTHGKVKNQLQSIINSGTYRNMLQDPIITMRNDRFCVPVKSEYRSSFSGMVHDQSSTGATLFIEPMSVVQLNNTLRELLHAEQAEIERILAALSALAANHVDVLESDCSLVAVLDFIFAKGELSYRMKASRPLFSLEHHINLKKARHPLLDPASVVPIDIYLGEKFTTLVVTGPNTGGKTVTLKTLGLLSLMGQSGLHIPAFDNSRLTVLDEIFADIGDEQSIEQSLSTFSSHMTNIIDILQKANYNSMVLFDELGAGTDPIEGAALAMAILENLQEKKILTAATTHYSELKVYAMSTPGVENASCEFDISTLRPTYRLLIGIPGKSNAFAISKRLGLTEDIISEAQNLIAGREVRFEDLITDLEINRKSALLEKQKAEEYRLEAEALRKDFIQQKDKIDAQKARMLQEAQDKAGAILRDAKAEADQIIRNMNALLQSGAGIDARGLEEERTKLREAMNRMQQAKAETAEQRPKKKVQQVRVGDGVFVQPFNQNGTVLSLPNTKGELQVQMGIMKAKVHLSQLSPAEGPKSPAASKGPTGLRNVGGSSGAGPKAQNIRTEVDVRGMTGQEALEVIDKYIDDAFLANLPQITIIHGKGTGVLRKIIHQFLRQSKHVKSFRLGNYGEGETGVTIVEFK
ncbi:endonuclease MutS2 [Anaerotalea alkaliphila]|uniref:Endonuclease MutS2 n=1 Tax=Anaerotalea alkaliphila TaxID=2662126 RepID=A0A7X5HU87_9FIRM|nr:endonuclease MutS2 [Anaerotalea alkaliphila]NDL66762.1 endonuclease MutS2 [Anaerotalea alkaliphila]